VAGITQEGLKTDNSQQPVWKTMESQDTTENYKGIYNDLQGFVWMLQISKNLQGFARMYKDLQRFGAEYAHQEKIYKDLNGFARICIDL